MRSSYIIIFFLLQKLPIRLLYLICKCMLSCSIIYTTWTWQFLLSQRTMISPVILCKLLVHNISLNTLIWFEPFCYFHTPIMVLFKIIYILSKIRTKLFIFKKSCYIKIWCKQTGRCTKTTFCNWNNKC